MEGGKKKGLGRGLGALIPQGAPAAPPRPADRAVAIDEIRPNPWQPRRHFAPEAIEELARSIAEQGIVQPLVVRRRDDGYELIAGERRLRAARAAGLTSVPVVVRELDDREALEIALVENLQREDLGPLEEADAYGRLMTEFGLTQDEVAKRVGKSRPAVANTLRLRDLPESVLEALRSGSLSAGHGRALLSVPGADERLRLAREAISAGLSVRQLEERTRTFQTAKGAAQKAPVGAALPEVGDLERQLMRELGTKVRIASDGKRGRIVIDFYSVDEFDRIVGQIRGGKRL